MMVTTAILACMKAKHGEQAALEALLRNAAPAAHEDESLIAWVALRFGSHDYGLFAAFADTAAREAHTGGALAALLREAGLHLDEGVHVENLDIVSRKLPPSLPAQPDTKALLLNFKAKQNGAEAVEAFLRDSRPQVMAEEETTSWFAVRYEEGSYSLFATFADSGGRLKNLVGYVPSQLARQALHLLGSMPDMDMLDVIAAKIACEAE
jgi:quinol monooxygenase YgiN